MHVWPAFPQGEMVGVVVAMLYIFPAPSVPVTVFTRPCFVLEEKAAGSK